MESFRHFLTSLDHLQAIVFTGGALILEHIHRTKLNSFNQLFLSIAQIKLNTLIQT